MLAVRPRSAPLVAILLVACRATPAAVVPVEGPTPTPAAAPAPAVGATSAPAPAIGATSAPAEPVGDAAQALPDAEPVASATPRTPSVGGPTLEIVARVRTGIQPKSVSVSPDGARLFVANFGIADRRNVGVHDAQTLALIGHVHFPGNATETALSRDGKSLFVSNFHRGMVEIVDASTLEVTGEVKVGSNPKFIVVDEARETLFVSNWSSRTVSAVDLGTRTVARTLRTGRRPRGMAVLGDGTLLVGAMWDDRVQAYGGAQTKPGRQFDACEKPRHLVLSPDGTRLYVSCSGDEELRWFDPATGELLGRVPTGSNPRTIAISDDGRHVAVADFSGSTVSLLDTIELVHRTNAVPGSDQIVGLAIAPGQALRIYATSWGTHELIELRPSAT